MNGKINKKYASVFVWKHLCQRMCRIYLITCNTSLLENIISASLVFYFMLIEDLQIESLKKNLQHFLKSDTNRSLN